MVLRVLLAATLVAVGGAGVPAVAQAPTYDLVIRHGRVLDGMGNPWILADVAIHAGRIVAVGTVPGQGRRELDARGKYVSPGWIDMMDQSGGVLPRNGLAENKLRMGVTTVIAGEGGTPVPASQVSAYFARLEQQGISVNFGTYFSATQARRQVLGMEARAPNGAELERMRAIVDTALQAGALGLTTALIYPPSSYHTTDELIALAKVASRYGAFYASHIRGEGRELLDAVGEAITIGEQGGVPVEIFHLKAAYQPGWGTLMPAAGRLIDSARARGVDVAADLYPYTAGGTGLEATIPSWAFDGGPDSLRRRLGDPAIRARLKREVETGSPGWWNIVEAAGGWDNIVLVNAANPAHAHLHGKSLAVIARELGKDPRDAAWDLVLAGQGRVMAIYHMMSEEDIATALRFPWTSIGSDAGAALAPGQVDQLGLPHPRSYGTFPRVIARYARDRKVISLEEAIRKMTSWPATRMRLAGRGAIREGLWADITIFDLDRLDDRATYAEPVLFPEGIDYVLVNGEVVIDQGRHTGARPGRVLYGPGKRVSEERPPADTALLARVDSIVQAEMRRARVPGVSVGIARNGSILLARGYGLADVEHEAPATRETIYRIGSITKQFTAAGIMRLVEQGKLRLDDRIETLLPEFPTQGHRVTLHHLLTHTSGIKSYTSLGAEFWERAGRLDLTDEQLVALFKDHPFDFTPGERYQYNNSAYYLLGMIIQNVTGRSYTEFVEREFVTPLGLTSTSYCDDRAIVRHRARGYSRASGNAVQARYDRPGAVPEPEGVLVNAAPISMRTPGAAGALCSTVLDLIRWQQAFDAGQVVGPESRRRMLTPATLNNGTATRYGYGLGLTTLEGRSVIQHSGGVNGFLTHLSRFPTEDLTIVVLGNSDAAPSPRIAELLARAVLGLSLTPPPGA